MNTENWTFRLGDRVTKTKGSSWTGLVVGFYSTTLTPEGYAVESENERGSVQIYPRPALRAREREPVAWLYEHPEGYYNTTTRRDDPSLPTYRGWIETPLYAHPPRGDQVARVVEWLRKLSGDEPLPTGCTKGEVWVLRRAANAIERGEPFNG